MHELSITQSLLDLSTRHAEEARAQRVMRLNLVIGALSSFVDDSIQFYWDIISRGTVCEGAQLKFCRIPADLVCLSCGKSYRLDTELLPCPDCHSADVKITSGADFRLDSIDIEP